MRRTPHPTLGAEEPEASARAVAGTPPDPAPDVRPNVGPDVQPEVGSSAAASRRGWPLRGMSAGPACMGAWFVVELVRFSRLQMMGVHDAELQRTLLGRFGWYLIGQQLGVLGAYLGIGVLLGAVGALGFRLWEWARGRDLPAGRRWLAIVAFTVLVEVWRIAVTVVHYPQLFTEALYEQGGLRRELQVILTSHVPSWLLSGGGWLLLGLFLAGPLVVARRRLDARELARRAGRAIGSGRRRLVLAGSMGAVIASLGVAGIVQRSTARAGEGLAPAGGAPPPNLLILAVDSLRADRVGVGRTTVAPNLAALAARSVQFDAAHVTIPRTFPSWVTLLTGRWPAHHGVRNMFPDAAERERVGETLPTVLTARGLQTAVVSDFSGEIFSRFPAGFAERDVPHFDMRVVLAQAGFNLHPSLAPWVASRIGHTLFPALGAAPDNADPDRLADRVIERIERLSRRGPFFVTAFFSAPHFPYAAPDPYYRRFTVPDYAGRFRYQKPIAALGNQDGSLDFADRAQVAGLYDGAVASVDDAIGRVLGWLEEHELDQNTIVVVLADHGENLYDDDSGMGHGEHLHGDRALNIPLLVYDPVHHFPPRRVPGIVRDIDLAPTLAHLLGASMATSDGVDLAPLLRGPATSLGLLAFAETDVWLVPEGVGFRRHERLPYPALPALVTLAPDDDIVLEPSLRDLVIVAKQRAVRTERWKLLYQPTRDGVRWSLFDLRADPQERRDVSNQHPEVVVDLAQRLLGWATLDGSAIEAGFVLPPTRTAAR